MLFKEFLKIAQVIYSVITKLSSEKTSFLHFYSDVTVIWQIQCDSRFMFGYILMSFCIVFKNDTVDNHRFLIPPEMSSEYNYTRTLHIII